MSDLTLLVLAAGMGSRYGGLKQLDPMGPGGETLLDYSVFDALAAGFNRVVFVIRRDFEEEFRNKVGAKYADRLRVGYAFQELSDLPEGHVVPEGRQKPWGTAHAILAGRHTVDSPFLAINADDFYGAEAYQTMAAHLRLASPKEFAMAGYRLRNSLSDHGTVSRGVCQSDGNNFLVSVREFTALEKLDGGAIQKNPDGTQDVFTGEEPVSMNFWGFTPDVFASLRIGFESFLSKSGGELKSEFYIPSAVADMISSGSASVNILPTESRWFGVTYREDKPVVMEKLAEFVSQGAYPCPLWK